MYPFGISKNRRQTITKTYIAPQEYLVLGSEPADVISSQPAARLPRFTYVNHYLTKRQVMRKVRRLKQQLK